MWSQLCLKKIRILFEKTIRSRNITELIEAVKRNEEYLRRLGDLTVITPEDLRKIIRSIRQEELEMFVGPGLHIDDMYARVAR